MLEWGEGMVATEGSTQAFLHSYTFPCGLLQPWMLGMGTEACFQAAGWGHQSSLFRPLEEGFRSLAMEKAAPP